MPRQDRFCSYPRTPHSSGQARVKYRGRTYYLGKFGSPASWAEYHRLLTEWRAGRLQAPGQAAAAGPCRTVLELIAAWWQWALKSQREPDGAPRREAQNCRHAYEPLARLWGLAPVADFGAAELLALQEQMARGDWLTDAERQQGRRGWCRNLVNRNTGRVKGLFRWGELRRHVPEGHTGKLLVVRGLPQGEHGVRETEDVPPVDPAVYAATLPHLRPVVRAVLELLALTGARPSELLGLRPCDLNRTGVVELARGYRVALGEGVWACQPQRHKTARKGLRRVILFGPRAQAVLAPFLERPPGAWLFSPAEEVALWRQEQRRLRGTPVQPSQQDRGTQGPLRPPGERYGHRALAHAVRRAAARAGQPHFSPYQLRHLAATNLAAEFGAEVAMIVLGHRHPRTTAVYALPALQRAADAVKDAG